MVSRNYDEVARNLIRSAKSSPNLPEAVLILLEYRSKKYFGSIQEITPEFSKEIVCLSKTSQPIPKELAESIRKIEPCILELQADNELDLSGRGHVLRRQQERLTIMTPEQTIYIIENPPKIIELNP